MNHSFLSLGSNMGDRLFTLQKAVRELHNHPKIEVDNISSIYETEPVGYTNQADFLNLVVEISTTLRAEELLEVCQSIENKLSRVREIRWGPRTIDLDILLFNHDNMKTEKLIVPHPRMHERAFVLIPLKEIAPDALSMVEIEDFHDADVQKEGVRLWKKTDGVDAFVRLES
jgi:2-amino-4-hydroxy-6-hydroxymethyldihydropteridine diphosphokinase